MIGLSARRVVPDDAERLEAPASDENVAVPQATNGWWQSLRTMLSTKMEPGQAQPAKRGAVIVFSIRVISAALLFVSQIILARWIGATCYGLYVALWSLVLVVGGLSHLGLGVAMMRMVPEYHASQNFDSLRGLLIGGRLIAVLGGLTAAALGGVLLWITGASQSSEFTWALILALACLPAYALTEAQDALGRGQSWTLESVAPPYVLRPALILFAAASSYALAFPANAVTAMACALAATWLTAIVQTVMVQRRVAETVPAGAAVYHFKDWLKVSLPLLTVSGSELILQNADVLLLNALRSPEEVGIYYAAAKTTCLALFVHYAVGSAFSGQFATTGALGDRDGLRRLTREAVAWTFWPSVAVTVAVLVCGPFILSLFGKDFQSAYPAMFILSAGLLARAATGPSEFVLNMLGQQNECAKSFAIAAAVSIALNLALIPFFGAFGAATATACAFATASALNWRTARRELGLNLFVFARQSDQDELARLSAFQPATWPEIDRRRSGLRREAASEYQAPLVFEVVRDEAGLDALREDWDRLCANSSAPSNAFMGFEWNRQWFKHYHAGQSHPLGVQLALTVGRRAGRAVVIWPLVTKRMAGMTYLYWMGQPVSQYGDVLVDAGDDKHAVLRQSWEFILLRLAPDVVSLRKVRADAAVVSLLQQKRAMPVRTEQAPFIAFGKDASFEVFEQRYSAKARKNRRRLLRRLEEKGPLEFVHVSGGDQAVALVRQAIAFKKIWLDERGLLSPALHDARFEQFFAAVSEGADGAACCKVSALKHSGETCAVMVSVAGGTRLAGHIFAYDIQFEKAGAGVLLLEECLRYALANGYEVFDLLAPGDAYKYDWCEEQVEVTDWAMASSVRGRLFTRLYRSKVREHVKETAKYMPAPVRKVISKALQGLASDAPAAAAAKSSSE